MIVDPRAATFMVDPGSFVGGVGTESLVRHFLITGSGARMLHDHGHHGSGHLETPHDGPHPSSGDAGPLPNASPEYAEATEAFRACNERMHRGMAVAPSGDVDRDFAAGMLPHHVGAVEMAQVELQFGRDPEMRRLAEAIVTAQEGEITLMREWLARHS